MVITGRVGQAGRGVAAKRLSEMVGMQQVGMEKQADPVPRRPTSVVQFRSRSDRKIYPASWWAGGRGGLHAVQRF